jgi:hypothetical protein
LIDKARALIILNNPRTGELVVNPTIAALVRHWDSRPRPVASTGLA